MSMRRPSARALALVTLVAAAISLLAPAARAESPSDVCAAFPHRQTYVGDEGMFRAPAWHYEKTVTIVYETSSCTASITDAGMYVLAIAGDASVYEGTDISGDLLEKREFSSVIRSSAKNHTLGWPIDWWACFDGSFDYVWRIDEVYTFAMSATNGKWLMVQRDEDSGETSGTVVHGCRKSDGPSKPAQAHL